MATTYNEPVADAVRGILDGHIVMERQIAERGRYPAINILKSISRTMPKSADQTYLPVITRARQVMATYADMEELIRLGAYRAGSSPEVDEAIGLHQTLEAFLSQGKGGNRRALGRDINVLSKFSVIWKPKTKIIAPLSPLGLFTRRVARRSRGAFRVPGLRGSKSR